MSNVQQTIDTAKMASTEQAEASKQTERPSWETPTIDDVSEQVMAQPYIRFT